MSQRRPYLALDLETSGELPEMALQPWRYAQGRGWITTMALAFRGPDGEVVMRGKLRPTVDDLRKVFALADAMQARIVTWNGTFDMAWLMAYGLADEVHKALWLDGLRAWKHLDITASFATEDHTYALKGERGAVATFVPEMFGYEADVQYHSDDPEEMRKLLLYNKLDTKATLIAVEKIMDQLPAERWAALLTETKSYSLVAAANLEGMHVRKGQVVAVNRKLEETVARMSAALAPHGVTETVIRSPKQLSRLLFDEWGLPDRSGKKSTAKDFLTDLVVEDDRADLLLKYREALGLRSKFIGGIVKSVTYNGDGKSRPQAVIFGTYTSRMTYNSTIGRKGTKSERQIGFALHQMKRGADFRSMIVAPPGYAIVEFDAAGQEFRWMAILSGDETMLELCQPGEDPHGYMASEIYHDDYRTIQREAKHKGSPYARKRQGGKVANLSLQYRTFPKTFRVRARTDHSLILSLQEATAIHATYQRTYKKVPLYWQRQIAFGRRNGYVETLAGRRVQIRGNWSGPLGWSMESTTINYPVQGTGGEQKYLAMACMKNRLAEYDARFAWDLHDGMYFYVPQDKTMSFAEDMKRLLDNLPYKRAWDFVSPIPLPFDVKMGPSWGELTELEL